MHSYRWSALAFADDYDEESADDTEGRREGCRLVHGGVPVCHGEIVLYFPQLFKSFCVQILFNLEFES